MQYFPDNNTSNFLSKLPSKNTTARWRMGSRSSRNRLPQHLVQDACRKEFCRNLLSRSVGKHISIQPRYYEKVQDVTDPLLKAGLANVTDLFVSYDAKRVTVRCAKGTVLELKGDIARMFDYLDNTSVRASDKK